MTAESKGELDDRLQAAVDRVVAGREGLTVGQIRTALTSALAGQGVSIPHDDLQAWATAIAAGERLRVASALR